MMPAALIAQLSLEGRAAVVTGAGSGIGAAVSELLGEAGARVALVDLDANGLKKTVARLLEKDCECRSYVGDASQPKMLNDIFAEVDRVWNRLDIVIANAGINGVWAPLDQIEPAEWDHTMAVNLTGAFLTLKYAIPSLRKQGGSVVIISSINGTRVFSNSGATAYACSKAALLALMKMSALELAKDRIRVNAICPGSVATSIDHSTTSRSLETIHQPVVFPQGEVPLTHGNPAHPRQIADLAWFLASDLSSHITGEEIFIDGGQSLLKG